MDEQNWKEMFVSMWVQGGNPSVPFDLDDVREINAIHRFGRTLLSHAARWGNLDVIQYLVQNGADVNAKNVNGSSPLHIAAEFGHMDAVEFFLDAGILIDIQDNYGLTPMYLASQNLKHGVVEHLIKAGASVYACNEYGFTVMHHACINGWIEVVKGLLSKGFDLNAPNLFEHTPMSYAIRKFHLVIVEQLLKAGAYFRYWDYVVITKYSELKQGILQNVELCVQHVLNKYNNSKLPRIYKIPVVAANLPAVENFKIASHSDAAQDIENCVKYEIKTNGYCNVLKMHPFSLMSLCVRSLAHHSYI